MTASPESDFRSLPRAEMEAMVARFEDKVLAAQLAAPPSRPLISKAVRRQGAERCPVWLRRVTIDLILRYGDALADLYSEFPDDLGRVAAYDFMIGYQDPAQQTPLSPVEALMTNSEWTNEWGTGWKHVVGGVSAHEVSFPLSDWSQLDDYLARQFPDPLAPGRLDAARERAQALRKAGTYSFGLFGCAFYSIFDIRGPHNVFTDFYTNPQGLARLIEALRDYSISLVRRWSELGVDSLLLLDDWGTQQGLMISPAMWREFFKPGYKAVFDEIHRCGMDAFLHSCGNVTGIIEDLIEIGLDVLDPVQTSAMDMEDLARRFGGRVSFCGAIDVQHLLPSATPQGVKDTIRRTVEVLGRPFGNALILAPTNTITPEVPLDNLRAMFEACHEQVAGYAC
jgi:uroporphyrinogen decarboxylase